MRPEWQKDIRDWECKDKVTGEQKTERHKGQK